MKTSVLIADDDPLLRKLLAYTLSSEPDIDVVGTVGTGREALQSVKELKPQVLLLDLHMPDLSGMEVLERLSLNELNLRVLMLTGEEQEEVELEAARAGARGFLHKSNDVSQLPSAIRTLAEGGNRFSPQVVDRILNEYPTLVRKARQSDRPINQLSDKEREVLVCLARGWTNQQIANQLYMSLSTVKAHLRNVFQKLDLSNRTEAAMYAVREGLLPKEE